MTGDAPMTLPRWRGFQFVVASRFARLFTPRTVVINIISERRVNDTPHRAPAPGGWLPRRVHTIYRQSAAQVYGSASPTWWQSPAGLRGGVAGSNVAYAEVSYE